MIKIEHTVTASPEQMNFIIEGMRNPMNSWDKSDSFCNVDCEDCSDRYRCAYIYESDLFHTGTPYRSNNYIGPNDYDLMKRLAKAGSDDRKFMRQMPVFVRITAPLYWWKEFDTYKVGTVANSCSTMHKIHAKEFTMDDFSTEHLSDIIEEGIPFACDVPAVYDNVDVLYYITGALNSARTLYNFYTDSLKNKNLTDKEREDMKVKQKQMWWQMIQMLPSSYNQTRNVTMNYEVLKNMYHARKNHKLDEWHVFCDWVKTLPYSELITEEFSEEE